MKKGKRLLLGNFILAGLLLTSTPVSHAAPSISPVPDTHDQFGVKFTGNHFTQKDIKRLEGLGFSKEEIDVMSDEAYQQKYAKIDGKLLSKETKYYKVYEDTDGKKVMEEVSEQTALQGVAAQKQQSSLGTITIESTGGSNSQSCSWLSMTTTVSVTRTNEFYTKNSFTWLTIPFYTYNDVVGIGHDGTTGVDTYLFEGLTYNYKDSNNVTHSDLIHAQTKNQGGYGWTFGLHNTYAGYEIVGNSGYAEYYLMSNTSTYNGSAHAFGHYAHEQYGSATPTVGFSTAGAMTVGVSFPASYDNAPDTDALFSITH